MASPRQTYATPRYDAMLERLRALAPGAELLPARDLFTSNADWRARWPDLLPTLTVVVVFTDEDGWIGAGVWKEVHDARKCGIPVSVLDDAGDLSRWETIRHIERRHDDWTRTARLDILTVRRIAVPGRIGIPHSPAWFVAVAASNPRQAMQTATVIDLAGRADCCSICGDTPAPVYLLAEPPFLSARFCDDCIRMQRAMYDLKAHRAEGGT